MLLSIPAPRGYCVQKRSAPSFHRVHGPNTSLFFLHHCKSLAMHNSKGDDHLLCITDGMAAAIMMSFSTAGTLEILQATAGLEVQTSPVYTTTSVGATASDTADSICAGPSTAAFGVAARLSAAAGQSSLGVNPGVSDATGSWKSTRLAPTEDAEGRLTRVEGAIESTTAGNDDYLSGALHFRRELLPSHPDEYDRAAITRLAVEFLGLEPRARAREALIELARAGWSRDTVLNNWSPDNDCGVEGENASADQNDEGQPPKKRQRLDDVDADKDNDDEDEDGNGKGNSKRKAKSKGKGKGRAPD